MLIQIHMLQNYAPSNLNRDDTGAPKDAVFGDVQRGRISSQAIKRSIRRSPIFEEAFGERGLLAQRTNRLPGQIDKALETLGADEETRRAIVQRIPEIGKREGGQPSAEDEEGVLKTRILVFLPADEVMQVARKLWTLYQEQGWAKFAELGIGKIETAMQHELPRSVDISMFGRMTTSSAFEDVQAAVQVAHAISTNAATPQFDYFTAVDDLSGEPGAGMIGNVEFNSNTYYKYFNIHWEKLVENLGGDAGVALEAVNALLEAAALAQPTGKQNTFAAHN
ncbi:MAG: type I-E CRISPR-associated protein Cas7/Cse4/CasC, partial [Ardenticatenaceae bacterium]